MPTFGLLDCGATNFLTPLARSLHTIDSYAESRIEGMGSTVSNGIGSGTIVFPTDDGFTDPQDVHDVLITPDQPLLLSEGALEQAHPHASVRSVYDLIYQH